MPGAPVTTFSTKGFKGTPSGRASRAEARPCQRARGNAKIIAAGCVGAAEG